VIRSLLYVPADSERFVGKAHERGADAVILDLEDAVAAGEKAKARAMLTTAVPSVARNGATVFVRINAGSDADAEAACRAGAYGLFVPKAREPHALVQLASYLGTIEQDIGRAPMRLVPMIEHAGAVFDARAIGGATPRVLGLIAGGEDLATSMGAVPTPEVLRLPKLMVHLAAKAVGVLSLGLIRTVADYRDTDAIVRAAREARDFGFDGATCVHPSVVPILNAAFVPSAHEVQQAQRLIAAAEAAAIAGKGAFVLDGRMVDEPVVARARALLARQRPPAS
jgi:citrate lyase subunit beta/citryl-CoA lyase